jgi:Tol biopolymer transport system component
VWAQLFVMDVDGRNEHQITKDAVDHQWPSRSHDGRQLTYTASNGSMHEQIWLTGADGSKPHPLRSPAARAYQESFSPDGKLIALISPVGKSTS